MHKLDVNPILRIEELMQNDKKCCENYDKIFNLRMLPEMEKMVSGGVRRHSKNRFNIQPTSFYPTCRHMIISFSHSLIIQGGHNEILDINHSTKKYQSTDKWEGQSW